jgi:hypothetical protein
MASGLRFGDSLKIQIPTQQFASPPNVSEFNPCESVALTAPHLRISIRSHGSEDAREIEGRLIT